MRRRRPEGESGTSATAILEREVRKLGTPGRIASTDAVNVSRSRLFSAAAAILLIAASLIAMVGCARERGALDGTRWRLAEWTLSSLSPGEFNITAEFADGQVGGHGGVNTYGGPYELGAHHAFAVGPLVSTEMAGPEPAMRAEGAYLTLLGQAASYRVDAGRLTLFDAGGNESLIFQAAPSL
jgi:heat shock protein HslJ